MKYFSKLFVVVSTVLIIVGTSLAQIEKGEKEFSVAASFMSRKYENSDDAWTSFIIPIRMGFFTTRNIEIEPEILFSKFEDEDTGFLVSGSLVYNFSTTNKENKLVPFFFGGLGYSNAEIFLPNIISAGRDDEKWIVLNLGGGFKIFMAKSVALRMEYRYQNFFGDRDYTYVNIFLGISAFFK